MKPDRRSFIKTTILSIIGSGPVFSLISCKNENENKAVSEEKDKYREGIELKKGYWVLGPETQKNLTLFASVLIPGVEKIDIKNQFMDRMNMDYGKAGNFDAGLWNLDYISKNRYKKPFYQLKKKEEITAVVKEVERSNSSFFRKFKQEIIKIYYTQPSTLRKLSFNGPPQPNGYLDYFKKPAV